MLSEAAKAACVSVVLLFFGIGVGSVLFDNTGCATSAGRGTPVVSTKAATASSVVALREQPAQLWLMSYMAPTMGTVARDQQHAAWRQVAGHCAGVIVQSYANCAADELAAARAAYPQLQFVPGLAVDTFLGDRADGIATNDWRNAAGWDALGEFLRHDAGHYVFLDFERLLTVPVADLRAVRAGIAKLPTDRTYFVYPAWGDDFEWYETVADVLGEHAIGITGSWCYRISPTYDGSAAAFARTQAIFTGAVAPICYGLRTGTNNWTAAEIWGLSRTLPAEGIEHVIGLLDYPNLQVNEWVLCDALEQAQTSWTGITATWQGIGDTAAAQAVQVDVVLHDVAGVAR